MAYLGIDGGGSHTRALLCDAIGQSIGSGLSGATNPRVTAPAEIKAHLLDTIRQACADTPPASIQAVHLGIAGCSDASSQDLIQKIARECMDAVDACSAQITVGHDLEIMLEGNLGSQAGILIIAGTGSACYGRDAQGKTAQCGGWGEWVDDFGSGSWIGLRALQMAVRQTDGRQNESRLRKTVMEFLQIDHMDSFKARIHVLGLSRRERAELAPQIIELAKSGDDPAAQIITEACKELCLLAATTLGKLQLTKPCIVLAGGLTEDHFFFNSLKLMLANHLPNAPTVRSQLSGVAGAVLLAVQNTNMGNSQETMIKEFIRNAKFN